MKKKYSDNFFKGSIKSNTGEVWTYDNGLVTCTEGNPKGHVYTWTGYNFSGREDKGFIGTAAFDGKKITWTFTDHKTPFYVYSYDEQKQEFRNESGLQKY